SPHSAWSVVSCPGAICRSRCDAGEAQAAICLSIGGLHRVARNLKALPCGTTACERAWLDQKGWSAFNPVVRYTLVLPLRAYQPFVSADFFEGNRGNSNAWPSWPNALGRPAHARRLPRILA